MPTVINRHERRSAAGRRDKVSAISTTTGNNANGIPTSLTSNCQALSSGRPTTVRTATATANTICSTFTQSAGRRHEDDPSAVGSTGGTATTCSAAIGTEMVSTVIAYPRPYCRHRAADLETDLSPRSGAHGRPPGPSSRQASPVRSEIWSLRRRADTARSGREPSRADRRPARRRRRRRCRGR